MPATPTKVGSDMTAVNTSGGSLSFTKDGNVQEGDFLICVVFVQGSPASVSAWPSGFTHLGSSPFTAMGSGIGDDVAAVLAKIATGSEPSTYSVTATGTYGVGMIRAYRPGANHEWANLAAAIAASDISSQSLQSHDATATPSAANNRAIAFGGADFLNAQSPGRSYTFDGATYADQVTTTETGSYTSIGMGTRDLGAQLTAETVTITTDNGTALVTPALFGLVLLTPGTAVSGDVTVVAPAATATTTTPTASLSGTLPPPTYPPPGPYAVRERIVRASWTNSGSGSSFSVKIPDSPGVSGDLSLLWVHLSNSAVTITGIIPGFHLVNTVVGGDSRAYLYRRRNNNVISANWSSISLSAATGWNVVVVALDGDKVDVEDPFGGVIDLVDAGIHGPQSDPWQMSVDAESFCVPIIFVGGDLTADKPLPRTSPATTEIAQVRETGNYSFSRAFEGSRVVTARTWNFNVSWTDAGTDSLVGCVIPVRLRNRLPATWQFFMSDNDDPTNRWMPLNNASSRTVQLGLNSPGSFSCTIPMSDPLAEVVEPNAFTVIAYRNGKAIWSGPVSAVQENYDEQTVSVNAIGWYSTLGRRHHRHPSNTVVYTEYAHEIAQALLNQVNAEEPTGIVPGRLFDLQSRTRTYEGYEALGSLIDELVNIENGFDWQIDPLTKEFSTDHFPDRRNENAQDLLVIRDEFDDTNGTAITSHSADKGGTWINSSGSGAQIVNKAMNGSALISTVSGGQRIYSPTTVEIGDFVLEAAVKFETLISGDDFALLFEGNDSTTYGYFRITPSASNLAWEFAQMLSSTPMYSTSWADPKYDTAIQSGTVTLPEEDDTWYFRVERHGLVYLAFINNVRVGIFQQYFGTASGSSKFGIEVTGAHTATTGNHVEWVRAWSPHDRPAPVVGYNTGPNNVAALSRSKDGSEMANHVIVVGKGQSTFYEDLSSKSRYGRLDDVISLSNVPDLGILQAMALIEGTLRSAPRAIVDVVLDPTKPPVVFDDLRIGESIYLSARPPVDDVDDPIEVSDGTYLNYTSFTGSNGTHIDASSHEVGGAWTEWGPVGKEWQIQNNRAWGYSTAHPGTDATEVNQSAEIGLRWLGGAYDQVFMLTLRIDSVNDYYDLMIENNGQVQIRRWNSPSFTYLTYASLGAWIVGEEHKFTFQVQNSGADVLLTAWRDGVIVGQHLDDSVNKVTTQRATDNWGMDIWSASGDVAASSTTGFHVDWAAFSSPPIDAQAAELDGSGRLSRSVVIENQRVRVFGMSFQIDDEGNEIMGQLQVSP